MSHPLRDPDSRDKLRDFIKANQLQEYSHLLQPMESQSSNEVEFYRKLQELLESEPSTSRLFEIEKERVEFLIAHLLAGSNSDHLEANRLALHWLARCRDLKDPDSALYFLLSRRDRETEILNLIYDPRLVRFFTQTELGREYLPGITKFFLRVYNLPEAWRWTRKALWHQNSLPQANAFYRSRLVEGLTFLIPLAIILLVLWSLRYPVWPWPVASKVWQSLQAAWPACSLARPHAATTLLACLYLALPFSLFIIFSRRFHVLIPLILPRLASGIVVGNIVLIFSEDVWKFVARLQLPSNRIALVMLALILSFLALANGIRNTLHHAVRVWPRTIAVFLLGMMQALLIGLVLCDLFSSAMTPKLETGLPGLSGLFGAVHPRFIIITAPLALLIGIFVQIIWEDKPITEPF